MGLCLLLRPAILGRDLHVMRDIEFMFPHHSILLRDVLPREVTGLLARLAVEEVPEVVGFDLREVALAHWKYYNRN